MRVIRSFVDRSEANPSSAPGRALRLGTAPKYPIGPARVSMIPLSTPAGKLVVREPLPVSRISVAKHGAFPQYWVVPRDRPTRFFLSPTPSHLPAQRAHGPWCERIGTKLKNKANRGERVQVNSDGDAVAAKRECAWGSRSDPAEGWPRPARGTEEALRKQTEVLQSILDSMTDPVAVADLDERLVMFNRAAEEMFGLATNTSADDWSRHYGLYRTDMVTLFPAEELPLRRAIRGEEVKDVEMFVRRHSDTEGFWILINGGPLRDAQGGLRGGVVVCRDISDRYRAALALQRSADELARSNAQLRRLTEDLEEVGLSRQKAYQELEPPITT